VIAPNDQRRMEAGIFNYGNDMTVANNPFEVTGLERLVECLDSGVDHIGKDALRRIRDEGVRRKLVGVLIDGEPLSMWLEDFWPVRSEGRMVGTLTSACHSPRLNANMGYVWVPAELAGNGTRLEIDAPGGALPATVTPLPFYDPRKEIPKG